MTSQRNDIWPKEERRIDMQTMSNQRSLDEHFIWLQNNEDGFDTICNAILQRTQNNMALFRSRISLPRRLVAAARGLGAHAPRAVSVTR